MPERNQNGHWLPGASGNPKGRPPKGSALAEAIRSKCDPTELASIALQIARTDASNSVRVQALQFLAASGYVRPEQRYELRAGVADDDEGDDLTALSVTQLEALRENDRQRAAILALALPPAEGS